MRSPATLTHPNPTHALSPALAGQLDRYFGDHYCADRRLPPSPPTAPLQGITVITEDGGEEDTVAKLQAKQDRIRYVRDSGLIRTISRPIPPPPQRRLWAGYYGGSVICEHGTGTLPSSGGSERR